MPAANSSERVIVSRVVVPPPLQPQMPTRAGSIQGCDLNQRTPATRSATSTSPETFLKIRFSMRLGLGGGDAGVDRGHEVALAQQDLLVERAPGRRPGLQSSITAGALGSPYT